MKSLNGLESPACSAYWQREDFAGLVMFARMEDGSIPKDMLYGELATGSRPAGRPTLRYKDVCKRDLRAGDIAPTDLEALAAD